MFGVCKRRRSLVVSAGVFALALLGSLRGELSHRTPAAAVLDLAPTSAEATPTPALVLVRWPWPSAGSSRWHGRLDAAKAATDGGSRWCDLPCASRRRGDALRAPATSHTVGDALQQSQCAANPPSNTRRARPLGGDAAESTPQSPSPQSAPQRKIMRRPQRPAGLPSHSKIE